MTIQQQGHFINILILFEKSNHLRCQFEYCLKSIRLFSPKDNIIVLTDNPLEYSKTYGHINNVNYLNTYFYNNMSNGLYEIYHKRFVSSKEESMATPVWFEWQSVSRWFLYNEFCSKYNIDSFWTTDSDVLWFCDSEKEQEIYKNDNDVSILRNGSSDVYSFGTSCFHNVGVLKQFCEWLEKILNDKNSVVKGWTDQCLWTEFLQVNEQVKYNFLTDTKDLGSFDPNLCVVDDWVEDNGSKALVWSNGLPYGTRAGIPERLKCLHCWGKWKLRMEELWNKSQESLNKS